MCIRDRYQRRVRGSGVNTSEHRAQSSRGCVAWDADSVATTRMEVRSLANMPSFAALLLAFCHMTSISIVTPGLWLYVNSMEFQTNRLGWAFAAPIIGGYLTGNLLKPGAQDVTLSKIVSPVPSTRLSAVLVLMLCVGIGGHLMYAFWHEYYGLLCGRFLVGCCTGTMVLAQQIVENEAFRDDATADSMVLRSRMVFFGFVQSLGTIFGLVLGSSFHELPGFDIHDEQVDQHVICGVVGAGLYAVCLVVVFVGVSPGDFRSSKKECDCPPRNASVASRFGIFVPAVVYEHGQVDASSLPDVFSTTVLLVFYFFVNNMLTGLEVLHGPFCVDSYGWNSSEIGSTWIAFTVVALIACMVAISCTRHIPCNRRMFGAVVLMFVSYGLQLQPHTPRAQYIGFLCIFACAFHVIDLAVTEIYIDKIGEGEPQSSTLLNKMEVMTWFSNSATLTRILGAIVAGYIYDYYSSTEHVSRRPYAIYAPPFAMCMVLMLSLIHI
eukprot:TRINITY_DN1691_c0_g1_i2.p1 TRINITY_DN1691_c0_g1~~TRINITY_DN1691_c0_g1_i2.p1  ORF type:complete len:494 (-),score=76.73 TRINITY_DN1691_c0_g1_i2:123-1604(-)